MLTNKEYWAKIWDNHFAEPVTEPWNSPETAEAAAQFFIWLGDPNGRPYVVEAY